VVLQVAQAPKQEQEQPAQQCLHSPARPGSPHTRRRRGDSGRLFTLVPSHPRGRGSRDGRRPSRASTMAAASQAEAFAAALQATQGKPGAKAPALATAPAGPAASQGSPKGPAGAKPPTVSQDASEVLASAPGTLLAADAPVGATTEGFHGVPTQPSLTAGGTPTSPEVPAGSGGRGMLQFSLGSCLRAGPVLSSLAHRPPRSLHIFHNHQAFLARLVSQSQLPRRCLRTPHMHTPLPSMAGWLIFFLPKWSPGSLRWPSLALQPYLAVCSKRKFSPLRVSSRTTKTRPALVPWHRRLPHRLPRLRPDRHLPPRHLLLGTANVLHP
jgi:hypothetical protein